jgi:carboxyl-terminal processing protease
MRLKVPSRATTTLLTGLFLLAATTIFAQKASAPGSNDETTAQLLCQIIRRFHISRPDIDDSTSKRLLNKYIKQLDSQKLYFTQADIDQFKKYETVLDDEVKKGDVKFAYQVFKIYLERLDQRTKLAHKYIDSEHDFTIQEKMYIDGDDVDWAKNEAEIYERWRKRIKYDLLSLSIEKTEKTEAIKKLHTRYDSIRNNMNQTEKIENLETYLTALTHCFDPHSTYMSPQTLENFRISMELKLEGIGAALRWKDGYTVVDQIVPGGAADKDGRLEVGDTIMGVGQETGDIIDVVQLKLMKVVSYIRGKKGTIVRLQVKKDGSDELLVYDLTRQTIELKEQAVKGKIIETGKRIEGTNARIGIINIPSFYRDFRGAESGTENFKSTVRDVLKVIKSFEEQGSVDGIVIDLRFNGGGALKESIDVSGLFIDDGPVVLVKDPDEDIRTHSDEISGTLYDGPIVVLCNRLSASASEIFAGAIKDYGRGIIIGDTTTHGKGTVQNIIPVSSPFRRFFATNKQLGSIKLTISQFYRVNGDSTQNRGVKSDVVIPSLLDYSDFGESFLDYALPFAQVAPPEHDQYHMVSGNIIKQIQERSQKRVKTNKEFQEVEANIVKFKAKKNRKMISLNEEILRKERDDNKNKDKDKEKEEEEKKKKDKKKNEDIFPKNVYNDEVLAITIDYVSILKKQATAKK